MTLISRPWPQLGLSDSALIAAVALGSMSWWVWIRRKTARASKRRHGYAALIGETPMITLESLSRLTGRNISVKCEHLNPGGTGKDRIALAMVEEAEVTGRLGPGGTVVEGTSGSTGIALAALCASKGYRCIIVMPDDQAAEKRALLERFGAEVHTVQPAAIANPSHYVNVAKRLAQETPGAVFMDQFETLANFRVHYSGTGPEISRQAGTIDAFVMSAGTGGTIAGVSRHLKLQTRNKTKIVLADPPGSSLLSYVRHGVCYTPQQSERRVKKHRYDTIAEGIGLDRITRNIAQASIDEAIAVSDQDALDMAHYLMHYEGIFVGSSSAMNICAAVVYSQHVPKNGHVVTIICDSGQRHVTRFWNEDFATREFGLSWPTRSGCRESVVLMAGRSFHMRQAKATADF
mmetsp:Transcript_58083/g.131610  ORF Transcript_58083/g.131610 Transcript_58083/m.131610 type:complete len:405 (-) Transcript_58083:112-1326(-)